MHLKKTKVDAKYKDGVAFLTCVWLRDDHSVALANTALVFAGPDIFQFGFVPGANRVYVLTARGTFFVPFTVGPRKK